MKSPEKQTSSPVLARLLEEGIVAVIRLRDPACVGRVVAAVVEGGIRVVEITMTVPGAREIIEDLAGHSDGTILIGAGTVIDVERASEVMDAGARFVVSPILNPAVIRAGRSRGIPVIPGCFSPTEIGRAITEGAELVKVFPASALGPSFLRDMRGPFPGVRLMPTGGVTIGNVGEWVRAGAAAVAVGSDLIDQSLIREERYGELTARAADLVRNYRAAAGEGHPHERI